MLFRRFSYENIFKRKSYNLPIICVGNLALGGTGKTPHTEYLIRLLKRKFKIATLSRGYGRKTKGYRLVENGNSVNEVGDEPLQYKNTFNDKIVVAVSENRNIGIRKLLEHNQKPEIILLDDALQHLSVKAGLNILLTDYYNLYIDDYVIPTGYLREFKSNSKYSDIIIVTKCPQVISPIDIKLIVKKIKLLPSQQIFFSYYSYGNIVPLTEIAKQKDDLDYSQLIMVTGIANPYPLKDYLSKKCYDLHTMNFKDHHNFNHKDIKKIITEFDLILSKNKAIITTYKDATRLISNDFIKNFENIPLYYIPLEVKFHKNYKQQFDKTILNFIENFQYQIL